MPESARLRYAPLSAADLDSFHALVEDPHVRRYLLDGAIMPRSWSADRIADSEALFARRGVGLWLARDRGTNDSIGVCGFLEIPGGPPEPQLVYALPEHHAGHGLGTEMARACIGAARAAGFGDIRAGVDAVNAASIRILERLGFVREATGTGAFGALYTYCLPAPAR